MKRKRFNWFVTILIGLAIIAVPFSMPLIFGGCKTEECFNSTYHAKETIATLVKVSTHGKSLAGEYQYEVDGKLYQETFRAPTSDFEQIGDQLYLLYDSLDPSNSFLTYRFFVPDDLLLIQGKIDSKHIYPKEKIVGVVFTYELGDYSARRNQYFPISQERTIDSLIHLNKEVLIGVVPENRLRSYLVFNY